MLKADGFTSSKGDGEILCPFRITKKVAPVVRLFYLLEIVKERENSATGEADSGDVRRASGVGRPILEPIPPEKNSKIDVF